MINPITELFLMQYYLVDAVFEKHFTEKKTWFHNIGKAFGISVKELDHLFEKTEDVAVTSITTEKEYFRHVRVKKYMSISSIENELAAVGESAHMQTLSCALGNLVSVLCYDIDESATHDSESGDEKVDILSGLLVEELIVDVQDGFIGIL